MKKILLVEDNNSIILGLEYLFKEEKLEYSITKKRKKACVACLFLYTTFIIY